MNLKVCACCKVEKSTLEFNIDRSRKYGLRGYCRKCDAATNQQYYKQNGDRIKAQKRKREKTPEYRKYLTEYRKRYRKYNLTSGLYEIKNIKTGKVYIGCSSMIEDRWSYHKSFLSRGEHTINALQHDYNKYGPESFEFNIIKEYDCETSDETLISEETRLILEHRERNIKLYNSSKKGD